MNQHHWTDSAFASIQEVLSGPPGTAAFDFDNTLIYNDLGEATMNYIALQGLLRADMAEFWRETLHPALPSESVSRLLAAEKAALSNTDEAVSFGEEMLRIYEYLSDRVGLETAYRWTRVFFAGHTEKDLKQMAAHVFAHEQSESLGRARLPQGTEISTGIRMYTEIRELIGSFVNLGWRVFVVTASPEPLIRAVISNWGLPEEQVLGMQLERASGDERYLPNVIEPLTFGYGKVARLLAEEPGPLRFAAGDSWGDYALLLHAERALLIDRGNNPVLRAHAERSGFIVQPRFISA